MFMPNKTTTDNNYRYNFQGQEKDPETGMEAFELRLWDGRLGRWLAVDPYGQYASPYLGMGNNPISMIDPDGGFAEGGGDPPWWQSFLDTFGVIENPGTVIEPVVISRSGGTITQRIPNSMEKWRDSGFIGNLGYNILNDLSVIPQMFMGRRAVDGTMKTLANGRMSQDESFLGFYSTALPFIGGEAITMKSTGAIIKGGEKAIVIGEGMYRVKPAAKSVGAKWYQAWSKNFPKNRLMTDAELKAAKARNARWINSKIKKGYKIYDIGPTGTNIKSPFYQVERDAIQKANYPTIPLIGF